MQPRLDHLKPWLGRVGFQEGSQSWTVVLSAGLLFTCASHLPGPLFIWIHQKRLIFFTSRACAPDRNHTIQFQKWHPKPVCIILFISSDSLNLPQIQGKRMTPRSKRLGSLAATLEAAYLFGHWIFVKWSKYGSITIFPHYLCPSATVVNTTLKESQELTLERIKSIFKIDSFEDYINQTIPLKN